MNYEGLEIRKRIKNWFHKFIKELKSNESIKTVAVYSHGNMIRKMIARGNIPRSGLSIYDKYYHRTASDGLIKDWELKKLNRY